MARNPGVLDGIMKCSECGGPMVKIGHDYRCIDKVEPEERVAVGFVPTKDSAGKLHFESTAQDQQKIQATQAWSGSEEIDSAYLQNLGLDLEKIRQFQLKHNLLP
jgi:hypothetical protein